MLLRTTTAIVSALVILFSTPVPAGDMTAASDVAQRASITATLERPVVTVSPDADISFQLIAVPPSVRAEKPVEVAPEPEKVVETPVAPPAPSVPTPIPNPNPVAETPAPTPQPPAVETRVVNVALAGGQNVVDLGAGPVLYTLPAGWPPYVVEHDFTGGWARFGSLSPGMQVTMTGLVTGTYTVGQIINVPKGGSTAEFRQFAVMPKVLLQTCIPGTDRMIVVGLY